MNDELNELSEVTKPETPEVALNKAAVDEEDIKRLNGVLSDYIQAKEKFDLRVKENNSWFEMERSKWEKSEAVANGGNPYSPDCVSAWLFSTIANKHADFMDNIPEPAIQAREESDETSAKLLTEVIPVILQQNEFEEKYDNASWDKLKSSAACYMVLWDKYKNGLGDISVETVDILNLFWQPGVKDIQKSKYLFYVEMVDLETAKQMYPEFDIKSTVDNMKPKKYWEQVLDNSEHENEEVAIVNCYYKKFDTTQNRFLVHYIKYINDTLIYASENDSELASRGWYDHGEYPFVVDPLFYSATSPVGISLVDINKRSEKDIELLKRYILENAQENRMTRYFATDVDLDFSEDDFSNPDKRIVRTTGKLQEDRIKPIQSAVLPAFIYSYLEFLINEQKETSNNKDVSTGSTGSGVTSGAAIAALQESGNKTSRDMLKTSYRAYAKICRLIIELIRQFYTEDRCFRIVLPEGGIEYKMISSQMLKPTNTLGIVREPIFDLEITAQKSSPFSRVAQNEMAQALYNSGAFSAERIDESLIMLSMMDFEGKDQVVERLNTQKSLQNQVQVFNACMTKLLSNPLTAPIAQQTMRNAQAMIAMQGGNITDTTSGMVQTDLEQSQKNKDNYENAVSGAMNEYTTPYANQLAQKTIVNTAQDNNDNRFTR